MAATPTGEFALVLYNLETLIASCGSFQSECGITGGSASERIAQARERVYWPGEDSPAERPFAWIRLADDVQFRSDHTGGAGFFPKFGLKVMFERAAAVEDTAKDRAVRFWSWVGSVIDEMMTLAKTTGHLEVTEIRLDGWELSDPKESQIPFDTVHLGIGVF